MKLMKFGVVKSGLISLLYLKLVTNTKLRSFTYFCACARYLLNIYIIVLGFISQSDISSTYNLFGDIVLPYIFSFKILKLNLINYEFVILSSDNDLLLIPILTLQIELNILPSHRLYGVLISCLKVGNAIVMLLFP